MQKKKRKILTLLWMFTLLKECISLKMVDIVGPRLLANASVPLIVLDCPFELSDKSEEQGLEVKWFYNTIPYPIYQWIRGRKPQDLIFFKGRLDTSYVASNYSFGKYRALAIRNPTIELTGNYTCAVSSFQSDDRRIHSIIVYSPARHMKLKYTNHASGTTLVSCHASGLFPAPRIRLYRKDLGLHERQDRSRIREQDSSEGTFVANAQLLIPKADLDDEEVVVCDIKIPTTNYSVREEIVIYKDALTSEISDSSSRLYDDKLIILLILLTIIILSIGI